MGFMDKAKEMLHQHDDKVDQGLDKAGEAAKGRFAGHEEHIDQGVDRVQGMTGDGDTTQAPAPGEAPPPGEPGEQPPPPPQ
ncbi:antitoxin [Pseudonocardia kunmingensis]|uniref:Antitoxin protein of toxin-antitoxin system n=1 Tax=Pseudonocardia kunmingensis TaxID=630975 RepID=A0A543E0N7_9PSEU|nr:antitoxin [Pseudonocardia kunmingensis]TQM15132.1 antitoxin protein of toxin-antitoxin system [Pseudonocardia kunmingensis]